MKHLYCVDLETTGFKVEDGAEVIEIAATQVCQTPNGELVIYEPWDFCCGVNGDVPPETSAVHGLIKFDVADLPLFPEVWAQQFAPMIEDITRPIMVAHNAKMERQFITPDLVGRELEWICTYKASLVVWPDAPAHNLGTLFYWLLDTDLNICGHEINFKHIPRLHRAGPDTYVNAFVLAALLKHKSVEELIELTSKPALLPKVNFGMHRGKRWSEMDAGFLIWVLQRDFDEDVRYTANYWLGCMSDQEDM